MRTQIKQRKLHKLEDEYRKAMLATDPSSDMCVSLPVVGQCPRGPHFK